MYSTNHAVAEVVDSPPQTLEEVDVARHREITSKAVSAILLLLLKWFKASRTSQGVNLKPDTYLSMSSRHYQVPTFGDTFDRLKLPVVDPQDVWLPGPAEYGPDPERVGGPQVSRSKTPAAYRTLMPLTASSGIAISTSRPNATHAKTRIFSSTNRNQIP